MSRVLALVTLTISIVACRLVNGGNADYEMTALMSQSFETVFFADSELFRGSSSQLPAETRAVLKEPLAMLDTVLSFPKLALVRNKVSGGEASIIVGARNFRIISVDGRPVLPSPIVSEASFVIHHKGVINLKSLLEFAPTFELNGKPVWTVSFAYGAAENSVTLYFFQPTSNHMIIGTGMDLLQTVEPLLTRKRTAGSETQKDLLPSDVESSRAWAYRNIRKRMLSSPSSRMDPFSMTGLNPRATCVIFSLGRDGKARFRYVTFPEDRAPFELNDFGLNFRERGSGIWEGTITLSDDPDRIQQLRIALGFFGFGAII